MDSRRRPSAATASSTPQATGWFSVRRAARQRSPAGFSAAAGNAQATLTWTDPRDASISHYEFRQALASAAFSGWQRIPGSSATTTTHTVGSLANGTQYKFQIRANNAHGASPASDEARATPADLPTVTAVRFASGPVSGDTYGAGEAVLVDVVFGSAIRVTGEPRLALMIGTNSRQAARASVAANSIRFRYVVQTSDVDADGIGIVASALTLGAGTIVGAVSGNAARLALGTHAWTANASHKVNGATGTAPTVSGVRIVSAPVSGDTYGAGEAIEAEVSFGALVPIRVTGSPQLTLRIGSQNRLASLASTAGQTLRFRYVVQSADADTNGIGVSALGLNSGTINSTTGTAANLALGSHAITDHADHKVNGSTATAPTVSGVAVASTPVSGDTYGAGERIEAHVTFAIGVSVTGSPQLALGIGTQSRTATYVRLEGQTLVFEYTVVAADADSNGLSIGASALTLNSGTINSVANAAANLGLSAHAIADAASHKVDGASSTAPFVSAVYIASTPLAGADTYGLGETIEVDVEFAAAVAIRVTGSPQLGLNVGGQSRTAALVSATGQVLRFAYNVQRADLDGNGIDVAANALTLNGGTILSLASAAANLSLGGHAISSAGGHKVNGRAVVTPRPTALTVASAPKSGDTYGAGETIAVDVEFLLAVRVTGAPQLALTLSGSTAQAAYQSGSDTRTLRFEYVVQAADSDLDGFGVGTRALTLNSGTIGTVAGTPALLSLGLHAIAAATGHKVNGATATAPSVVSATIVSAPVSGDSYGAGERIEVAIGFDIAVQVTGAPQLELTIGTTAAQAALLTGSGTKTLTFGHVVQSANVDANGIDVAAGALALNSGTIQSAFGGVAALGLGSHAIATASDHKVNGATANAPTVSAVSIASSPVRGDTYGAGEPISVDVAFTMPVTVTGAPQLALTIGSNPRQAAFAGGSGTKTLTFSYTAQTTDVDANGIGVAATALALNSGTIQSLAATNATLALGSHAITAAADHKVNGRTATVPTVSARSITSRPASGDTYGAGETITLTVTFNIPVTVTGSPQVIMTIGRARVLATYASGTGTTSLNFSYTVLATETDANGVSVANTLALNSGTIQSAAAANASLSLGTAITDAADHKVNGAATVPTVASVAISSDAGSDATYEAGENISVQVAFQIPVTVTTGPQLALTIDSSTAQAAYASGSGTKTLTFSYTVLLTDADSDGISIGASALTLGGGTIQSAAGTNATLGLGSHAIANAAAHKVDGALGPPGVSSVALNTPLANNTYERGEVIEATVTFNKAVDVTGTPQLALRIGSATKQASYASGTGGTALKFAYTVVQADADPNGISIAADALTLNSGTIDVAGGTTDALLSLTGHAIENSANHMVSGATFTVAAVSDVVITSTPDSASTYNLGEEIEVAVTFTRPVAVTGAPQLALTIGLNTRQAAYVAASSTSTTLAFSYQVRAADSDADGIDIAAAALTLNSGAITDARDSTQAATRALGTNAIATATGHKVDGSQGPPGVSSVALNTPAAASTYERGEVIEATVTFNKAVDVTGTPQLALGIGSQTRQADYASGTGSTALVFRYTVVQADVDANGLSIAAAALALNSGTIDVAGGTTDAVLSLAGSAIADSASHKVSGATFTVAAVSDVAIASTPASGQTYNLGETIEATVTFTRPVAVTGAPQLALTIGNDARQAAYVAASSTSTALTFSYQVRAADADADGIDIAASALTLNSGTINDARDSAQAASLALGTNAISTAANHKVDGSQGPPGVSSVALNAPVAASTFERGEIIEITVTFNKAVDVTGTPQLALRIGTETRQADYASGTGTVALVFRYTVVQADVDAGGLSIAADALSLNAGTIDAAGATTDAVLSLAGSEIADSASHKVSGATFTAASASAVAISSTPASGQTYGNGEQIEATVTFTRAVAVTGTPQLALRIGTETRQADYASGTGSTTLTFQYTVLVADRDANGISIAANALALNSGAINDARDATAAAELGDQRRLGFRQPQGGRRPGRPGSQQRGAELAGRGRHLRTQRDHRSHHHLQQDGGRDRHPAGRPRHWHRDPPGGLRRRHRHGCAQVPLHRRDGGRRCRRRQHRRRRADVEQRHHRRGRRHHRRRTLPHRLRDRRQRQPLGGGRHVHRRGGERRGHHQHPGQRPDLRPGRGHRGHGDVRPASRRNWRTATGVDDRHGDPPSGLRGSVEHDDGAGLPLHRAGGRYGRQRHRHRRHGADPEQRHDQRRPRRGAGSQPRLGHERHHYRREPQGGQQPRPAGRQQHHPEHAAGGRDLRARGNHRGHRHLQQGSGRERNAATRTRHRHGDPPSGLRLRHRRHDAEVQLHGGAERHRQPTASASPRMR